MGGCRTDESVSMQRLSEAEIPLPQYVSGVSGMEERTGRHDGQEGTVRIYDQRGQQAQILEESEAREETEVCVMADIEKVMRGLKCEGGPENCGLHDCPYYDRRCSCEELLHADALKLLEEQKKTMDLQHTAMRGSCDFIQLLYEKIDEVVLCKDCRYRGNYLCPFYQKYKGEKYDDWFCADGKRRDAE